MFGRRSGWRAAAVLCGAAALAFPLVMPLGYGRYELPVKAPGGELRWVTEPANAYSSSFKRAQQAHEAQYDYHLIGWSAEGGLGYRSACQAGTWRYDPATDRSTLAVLGVWDTSSGSVVRWDGHSYLDPPAGLVTADGFHFLTLERAVSPDGRWEAVVVRRFYGPSDVVLVERVMGD
jgi:hypothetical protein